MLAGARGRGRGRGGKGRKGTRAPGKNVDKTYFVFYKFRESDDYGIQSSIIDILLIFKNKDEYIIPKIEGKVDNSIFYNRDSFGIKNYNINN